MAKGTRITLTKSQFESPTGRELVERILTICHDGVIEDHEVKGLHDFLEKADPSIAAIGYLRALTRETLADGVIDEMEAYRLKQAFERVVPKEVRGIVSTHLADIGLPSLSLSEEAPQWAEDEATSKQIQYIIALGGTVRRGLTKGKASDLIEELLERRPPTPRQRMLLRFFDRLDLMNTSQDEVSEWIDDLYATNPRCERAWDKFKRDTGQDPSCQDESRVPIGAYKQYVSGTHARSKGQSIWRRLFGKA